MITLTERLISRGVGRNSEKIRAFQIEKLFENRNEAFVLYELEPNVGSKFRNTEFFTIAGNKIKEVEVYFGSLPEGTLRK
jgi:hypothetical protein